MRASMVTLFAIFPITSVMYLDVRADALQLLLWILN